MEKSATSILRAEFISPSGAVGSQSNQTILRSAFFCHEQNQISAKALCGRRFVLHKCVREESAAETAFQSGRGLQMREFAALYMRNLCGLILGASSGSGPYQNGP
jgi:hypothetical protein